MADNTDTSWKNYKKYTIHCSQSVRATSAHHKVELSFQVPLPQIITSLINDDNNNNSW